MMKRSRIFFLLSACLLAVLSISCITEEEKGASLGVGDRLPEFSVETSDGAVVSNVSLMGNVSVIMFFHTGCPDCQQALPVMQLAYDEYAPLGVGFICISREEGADEVTPYWERFGYTLPYSAQSDRHIYSLFATSIVPRIYISDAEGVIRHVYTDDPVLTYDDLSEKLSAMLAE